MAVVIVIALFWLSFLIGATSHREQVMSVAMALGYLAAGGIPVCLKWRHIKSQNRILARCRALFLLGSDSIEKGDRATAEVYLRRIAWLERVWRFGNSWTHRVCLILWILLLGFMASVAIRLAGSWYAESQTSTGLTSEIMMFEIGVAMLISLTAPLHALSAYAENWTSPWNLEDCEARLRALLYGPRALGPGHNADATPNFDGLSPLQIFGIGPHFSKRDLDVARRRLVRELHPDLWHHDPRQRSAREAALKRVNAAYDFLRRTTA